MNYENRRYENIKLEQEKIEGIGFCECEFVQCEFHEIQLKYCTFKDCTFQNCVILNPKLQFTEAKNNRFECCTLIGVNWQKLVKPHAIFKPFDTLEKCTLRYNVFYGMKLRRFQFTECDLSGSFLEECDLTEADFQRCKLTDTLFAKNDLQRADFREARDYTISAEDNKLRKAKFSFPEVLNLLKFLEIEID